MTSQSKPAALIELATSGEALCSTTPTVGRALSFARNERSFLRDHQVNAPSCRRDCRCSESLSHW